MTGGAFLAKIRHYHPILPHHRRRVMLLPVGVPSTTSVFFVLRRYRRNRNIGLMQFSGCEWIFRKVGELGHPFPGSIVKGFSACHPQHDQPSVRRVTVARSLDVALTANRTAPDEPACLVGVYAAEHPESFRQSLHVPIVRLTDGR